ncbi:MAG TPA: ATP-grasp domain-containing protein [Trebonia sp.]|jgi:biotin carboxylase|nr:ATP-grasp domain-containing protein [Trebonia sp.]
MPKLLYLGLGGDNGRKRFIAEGLVQQGYQLIVLNERLPTWIEPFMYCGELADPNDPTALERTAAVGRAHHVDGVFTCDEFYVELAAGVARALRLPGLTEQTAMLCRDKHAMRQRLAEAGIPSPQSIVVSSLSKACDAAEMIGYPVVLKPRNLGGSVGVVRADGTEDVERFFPLASTAGVSGVVPLSGLLVEKYINGPEFSVESVTANGITTVCGITEKVVGFPPFFEEIGQYATPVQPDNPLHAQLIDITLRVHKAFGVTVGITHCEILMTASGPYVVEIGARAGGDRIPVITKLASGIDLIAAGAATATGAAPDLDPVMKRAAGVRMVYPHHEGVISRLDAKRLQHDLLEDMAWYAEVGQFVALPPRAFLSRLAYLVATGESKEEVARRLDDGEAALDIEIDPC